MNFSKIGKYYLGNGGVGDLFLFLSTFYDEIEIANVVFLANDINSITEILSLFPKIERKIIVKNNFQLLKELYFNHNCVGTGILPKNLDYNNWYKVDIFKEYGVKQFPEFIHDFSKIKVNPLKKQMFVQSEGSNVDGIGKKRILSEHTMNQIHHFCAQGNYEFICCSEKQYNNLKISELISIILGSDIVVSVDSFSKTISAMSKIKTIVYESIYSEDYLAVFKDKIDYGHYVFIFPWIYIEHRSQSTYPKIFNI